MTTDRTIQEEEKNWNEMENHREVSIQGNITKIINPTQKDNKVSKIA